METYNVEMMSYQVAIYKAMIDRKRVTRKECLTSGFYVEFKPAQEIYTNSIVDEFECSIKDSLGYFEIAYSMYLKLNSSLNTNSPKVEIVKDRERSRNDYVQMLRDTSSNDWIVLEEEDFEPRWREYLLFAC